MTWQDIKSAPKDGTIVLLAKIGRVIDTGRLEEFSSEWRTKILDKEAETKVEVWWAASGYWSPSGRWIDGHDALAGPSHWMKLPDPPKDIL